jgi:hypothetical protein
MAMVPANVWLEGSARAMWKLRLLAQAKANRATTDGDSSATELSDGRLQLTFTETNGRFTHSETIPAGQWRWLM